METPLWEDLNKPLSKIFNVPESDVVNWFTENKQMIKIPLKPEDIAHAVCWLASPETRMITGQAVSVCGGEVVPTF